MLLVTLNEPWARMEATRVFHPLTAGTISQACPRTSAALAWAAQTLKLERYREDYNGPWAKMTCKFMKHSAFCAVPQRTATLCALAQKREFWKGCLGDLLQSELSISTSRCSPSTSASFSWPSPNLLSLEVRAHLKGPPAISMATHHVTIIKLTR